MHTRTAPKMQNPANSALAGVCVLGRSRRQNGRFDLRGWGRFLVNSRANSNAMNSTLSFPRYAAGPPRRLECPRLAWLAVLTIGSLLPADAQDGLQLIWHS